MNAQQFPVRVNAIATATKVLQGLRDGAPMTDSARDAMPRLVEWLRELDAPELADEIAAEFAKA